VARNAGAINAVTRTLRIEVDVPNKDGAVLPGSYGQVRLSVKAAQPGLSLPVNTLLYRPEGLQVATVDAEHKVLLKIIKPGRDFGTRIEVASGLAATDRVILNPSDSITNGQAVRVSTSATAGSSTAPANGAGSRS
jgi:multidrug efflux pump subunit AcrA (membrane-fusion protein)